jgi:hypothetical protein
VEFNFELAGGPPALRLQEFGGPNPFLPALANRPIDSLRLGGQIRPIQYKRNAIKDEFCRRRGLAKNRLLNFENE